MIGKTVKTIGTGDLTVTVHSRKKDELKDISVHLQDMIDNIRRAVVSDRERIRLIGEALDKNDAAAAKENLAQLTNWYKI